MKRRKDAGRSRGAAMDIRFFFMSFLFFCFNLPNLNVVTILVLVPALIIVTSQLWHQPVTSPACLCMLASTSSAFQVRVALIFHQFVKWGEAKQHPPPGSPVSHSRPGALLGERSKQLFPAAVIPVSEGPSHMACTTSFQLQRHIYLFPCRLDTTRLQASALPQRNTDSSAAARRFTNPMVWRPPSTLPPTAQDPLYLSASPALHKSEVRSGDTFIIGNVPILVQRSHTKLLLPLGASAFQAMQYLPHQQPGYPVHSHFTSQPGRSP